MGLGLKLSILWATSCQEQPSKKFFVVDLAALDSVVNLKNSECDIYIDKSL